MALATMGACFADSREITADTDATGTETSQTDDDANADGWDSVETDGTASTGAEDGSGQPPGAGTNTSTGASDGTGTDEDTGDEGGASSDSGGSESTGTTGPEPVVCCDTVSEQDSCDATFGCAWQFTQDEHCASECLGTSPDDCAGLAHCEIVGGAKDTCQPTNAAECMPEG